MEELNKLQQKFNIQISPEMRMPYEIPNVGRDNLSEIFNDLGYRKGAEVGVLQGEFSEKLCMGIPSLELYCIDPWKQTDGFKDYTNHTLAKSYRVAKERLAKYNVVIIKKTSIEAVKQFEDNSLDFVYLDGDHTFKNVVMDICEWIKKIRIGGIISGHDFRRYVSLRARAHVPEAVGGYTVAYHIRPWFVLGRKQFIPGEIRDRERSWMWVKLR